MRVVNCRNTFILIFSSGSDVDKLTGAIASVLNQYGHWGSALRVSLPKTLPSSQLRKLGLEKKLGKVLPRYANKFIKKGN